MSAVGYWGLDRYVIDHVAIDDVAAYEAALSPSPTAAPAPAPVVTATSYLSGTTSIEIFKNLGATVAYNLDGGGSATMYFNGALVNKPQGKDNERAISDILYIA